MRSNESPLPLFLLPPWDEAGSCSRPSFLLPGCEEGCDDGLPSLFPLPSSRRPRCPTAISNPL